MLLDKWIADGVFKPSQVSKEPTEEERRDLRFYRFTIMCSILPQNVGHSVD